mmetsp:Transcript_12884/g.26355  ORF Transcript_12884/g.26355 Transcript_12884/m.26355 type:complete len:82 (-) Transcript_12884:1018-1263(-)
MEEQPLSFTKILPRMWKWSKHASCTTRGVSHLNAKMFTVKTIFEDMAGLYTMQIFSLSANFEERKPCRYVLFILLFCSWHS